MNQQQPNSMQRRTFLTRSLTASAAAAVTLGTGSLLKGSICINAPGIVTSNKSGSRRILGSGDHQFEFDHDWAKLPEPFTWQTTHNVAVDAEGLVYVIHEGRESLTDHPSIFVFGEDGQLVRSFGSQFQGGGHGIEVRQEGSEQFLYVCAYQQVKSFAKMTLTGETVWQKYAPMESGVYAANEDTQPEKVWGRDRFMPTNFAFLDDGEFLLADGYGSFFIHHYDREGNWKSCFGGPGAGEGTFNTPHGIWIDRRGDDPIVVICDRAHHTLQRFSTGGEYIDTMQGYGLPANVDTYENLMVVPELQSRVSLLDENNDVVAQLGDDRERILGEGGRSIRNEESAWRDGLFVHPHDACFDLNGNLIIAEWVASGRVSRLTRI